MTSSPLNPRLYRAMNARLRHRLTGAVRIASPRQMLEACYETVRGRIEIRISAWGESYQADCPFCVDTRGRLSLSYYFGVFDSTARTRYYHLWKCFNNECQKSREHRDALVQLLAAPAQHRAVSVPGVHSPALATHGRAELPRLELPGETVLLTELGTGHPAIAYLLTRGFDPSELVRLWGVGYCVRVPPGGAGSLCAGRIIVPVRRHGTTIGFQARFVGVADWRQTPKYLTYFPKSQALYGFDEAEHGASPLVVVEGVTDAWRYGSGAVARLGRRLSSPQTRLLLDLAGTTGHPRPIVIVPDGDDPGAAEDAGADALDLIKAGYMGAIGMVSLPAGTDPGSTDRSTLQGMVATAVACLGSTGRATP